LSADAVRITPGARILIEDWGGDGPLEARVKRVEPAGFMKVSALGVEEQRVNVIGELTAPVAALGDGFRLETRTVIWEGESVLKVPIGALSRAGDEWAVFVLDGDRARSRSVEVGHRGGGEVEIREGLKENERVILHPSDKVADGVRVEPARRE
jgi:HlyD family secretion protein